MRGYEGSGRVGDIYIPLKQGDKMKIESAVFCHVGRVRSNNEDNYYINGKYRWNLSQNEAFEEDLRSANKALYAVSDGMGGEDLGELASWITVRSLSPAKIPEVKKSATEAIARANDEICSEIRENGGRRIGATLVMLYIDDKKAISCNVGDSRAYLFRDQSLIQISEDHNEAMQMVRMGIISKEEAENHHSRHALSQHLGIFKDELLIEPYFSDEISLEKGDMFLLCSDGLTDMVTDEEICRSITEFKAPSKIGEALKEKALLNGGKDNITVLVAKVR